jgi:hypothetical protein
MAGTFDERITALMEQVGTGDLTGTVEVNQRYSHWQHEGLDFVHPRGGQALFLSTPLMERFPAYLEAIAKTVLGDGGKHAMEGAMENLSEAVAVLAPVEFANLRASGHPTVTDNGAVVYDRAPLQHRLTEEELRAERGLFNAPDTAKEHEAAWLATHPGEPGGAHRPQSHARMTAWLRKQGG